MGVSFVPAAICRVRVAGRVVTRMTRTLTARILGVLVASLGERMAGSVVFEGVLRLETRNEPILTPVLVMTGVDVLGVRAGVGAVSCCLPLCFRLLLWFRMSHCLPLLLLKSLPIAPGIVSYSLLFSLGDRYACVTIIRREGIVDVMDVDGYRVVGWPFAESASVTPLFWLAWAFPVLSPARA